MWGATRPMSVPMNICMKMFREIKKNSKNRKLLEKKVQNLCAGLLIIGKRRVLFQQISKIKPGDY